MSRIGREPITIPAGVNIEFADSKIVVSGPLGRLERTIQSCISAKIENGILTFVRDNDEDKTKAMHGLTRALVNGMVEGVTKGFKKSLTVNGVGYKSSVSGKKLNLSIGFSHPVEFAIPDDIKIECPSVTEIIVSGFDKEKVGQTAANIRSLKPVEPYHLYGIRYTDEKVVKKEGKKAAAKKK